jgi:GNAT superfamily N-acetyltransferase
VNTIAFRSAASLSLEQVTLAFNLGFTGYYLPMAQTPDGLAQMMRENDVRLDASVALAVEGELAGIGLVGVRESRGWVAGMGVAPQWRGRGIGRRLMERLLAQMRAIGLTHAQLEVLEVNTSALALYRRIGFRATRKLLVYHGPLRLDATPATRRSGDQARVRGASPRVALQQFAASHAVAPAWQREQASLVRVRSELDGLGLWDDGHMRAYTLFSRQSGGYAVLDAGALASDAEARRDDIMRLLRKLAVPAPETTFRAINVPPGDALGAALEAFGCPVVVTQYEMSCALR